MESFLNTLHNLEGILDYPLFKLGASPFTVKTVLAILIGLLLLFVASATLKRWMIRRLNRRYSEQASLWNGLATVGHYAVLAMGSAVVFQSAGVDLSALTVLTGALGIGIGFGLQTITSNFISGIIILLERPFKVGDTIEVNDVRGDVFEVNVRATTIITGDNIAVIVPNSQFISGLVVNWSYTDRDVRFRIPVGVAYSSDPEEVRRILLEVAMAHPGVLKEREADVFFDSFGDSSLNFQMVVWSREFSNRPARLKSELNFAIAKAFREQHIEMPFPQRDLHIKDGSISVQIAK